MKPLKFLALYLLCVLVSLSCWFAIIRAEDALNATDVQTQPSKGVRFIQFVNDQLTVKVKDVSLQELLEEIARQGSLTLVLSGALEERITIEIHRLPLEEGLRRILRHQGFAVEYAQQPPEKSPSTVRRPKTLWIFPKGEEAYPVQTTLGDDSKGGDPLRDGTTDIRTLQAALTSKDSWERAEAVEALGVSGRSEAVAPLKLSLKDEDEDVREAGIAALANIGGDAAAKALAIAVLDQDASLREAAVEALGEIGGESAIRLLEQALTDEDESVREAAAEVLEELRDHTR